MPAVGCEPEAEPDDEFEEPPELEIDDQIDAPPELAPPIETDDDFEKELARPSKAGDVILEGLDRARRQHHAQPEGHVR